MEFLTQGDFWQQFALAFLGMLVHFSKKKIREESWKAIKTYFSDNLKSTITTVVITFVAVAGYYTQIKTGTNADIIAVFTLGFTCDSALNKWEAKK